LFVHLCVVAAHSVHDALHAEEVAYLPQSQWCELGKSLEFLPVESPCFVLELSQNIVRDFSSEELEEAHEGSRFHERVRGPPYAG
jgi:hypothetical protein